MNIEISEIETGWSIITRVRGTGMNEIVKTKEELIYKVNDILFKLLRTESTK